MGKLYRISTQAIIANIGSVLMLAFHMSLVHETEALKLTNMSAPAIADPRNDMNLDCHFDMGNEELYAVKWYKDDQEFFRFMPHQQPHMVSFPVAGIHMAPQATSCGQRRCKVRLTGLTRDHSGGSYRCEISSEAPAFRLASETRNVTVAALPYDNPRIEDLSEMYHFGDTLTATCVSSTADPTPVLTWYINNVEAPSNMVGESISTDPDSQGLAARSISLRLPVDRKNTLGNSIQLKCVSVLPGIPVHPQTVSRTVGVRVRLQSQVNNEKLHSLGLSGQNPKNYNNMVLVLLAFGASWWLH